MFFLPFFGNPILIISLFFSLLSVSRVFLIPIRLLYIRGDDKKDELLQRGGAAFGIALSSLLIFVAGNFNLLVLAQNWLGIWTHIGKGGYTTLSEEGGGSGVLCKNDEIIRFQLQWRTAIALICVVWSNSFLQKGTLESVSVVLDKLEALRAFCFAIICSTIFSFEDYIFEVFATNFVLLPLTFLSFLSQALFLIDYFYPDPIPSSTPSCKKNSTFERISKKLKKMIHLESILLSLFILWFYSTVGTSTLFVIILFFVLLTNLFFCSSPMKGSLTCAIVAAHSLLCQFWSFSLSEKQRTPLIVLIELSFLLLIAFYNVEHAEELFTLSDYTITETKNSYWWAVPLSLSLFICQFNSLLCCYTKSGVSFALLDGSGVLISTVLKTIWLSRSAMNLPSETLSKAKSWFVKSTGTGPVMIGCPTKNMNFCSHVQSAIRISTFWGGPLLLLWVALAPTTFQMIGEIKRYK